MNGFEGSFLGDRRRIDAQSRLECGVCWWVYDPERGDPLWQIPPGTAFSELPEHWRCPNCDTPQAQFMVIRHGRPAREAAPRESRGAVESAEVAARLLDAYGRVAERMRGLPVYREALPLGLVGPRRCEHGLLALLYTPWCMNMILLADDAERRVEGTDRQLAFPSGSYAFTRGYLKDFGAIESCSLFSPMDEFADAAAVEAVAEEVLRALFERAAA